MNRLTVYVSGKVQKVGYRKRENAIEIKNTLIQVASVEKAYSPASGEFSGFGKIVADDETDSRLDKGIDVMNKMLVAIIDVNKTLVDYELQCMDVWQDGQPGRQDGSNASKAG